MEESGCGTYQAGNPVGRGESCAVFLLECVRLLWGFSVHRPISARLFVRNLPGRTQQGPRLAGALFTIRALFVEETMKPLMMLALLCLCALCFGASAQAGPTKTYYTVYCANGKIEVDMRDPEQMKSARGSNTFPLRQFEYRGDAENFAKSVKPNEATVCKK